MLCTNNCACPNLADRYVVIGAQRDSMTSGYAKSAVGTTLLMELARVFNELKKGMVTSIVVQMHSVHLLHLTLRSSHSRGF